jgi:REP element-mobilizing transposase RayT
MNYNIYSILKRQYTKNVIVHNIIELLHIICIIFIKFGRTCVFAPNKNKNNEILNNNKKSLDETKKDEHTGSPLRKIKKNGEQIMENEKNVAHTMGSFVPKIMQWLKTMTTNEYIYQVKQDGWKPFHDKLWQRNYYEHIIRNEVELNQILEYIIYNPLKQEFNQENKQYYER